VLVTQGDACFYPDEPIDDAHVLGPVTAFLDGSAWKPVGDARPGDRAANIAGRALLGSSRASRRSTSAWRASPRASCGCAAKAANAEEKEK
jgi:hypothetical protein